MSNLNNRRHLSLGDTLRSESDRQMGKTGRTRRELRRESATPSGSDATELSGNEVAESGLNAEARQVPERRDERLEVRADFELKSPDVEPPEVSPSVLMLPQRRRTVSWGGLVSFFACVALPTLVAAVYYTGFASSQYVVEWRFTIRDANTASSTSIAASTMTALLGSSTAASDPDNYMVTEYMKSEQAVMDLEKRIGLRAIYSRDSIDFWSRFEPSLPIERFTRYWRNMVTASYDQITGTTVAEVRAFTPEDALLVANTLLDLTENLINEGSQRPLREAIRYAEAEVARAEERVKKIRLELQNYRNTAAVIDPNSSVVLSNASVAGTLRQTIAQYQADLSTMLRGGLGQGASQVQTLKSRIKATQDQLKEVDSQVTKSLEGNKPISEIVGRYEELDLERQFAQSFLTSTMQSLEQARANVAARRQFVVPYVRPVLPQSSTYPARVVAVATVAGACLLLWVVALLLGRSIREHLA